MGIPLEWTAGMSTKEKEEFQELLTRNTILTNRLLTMLKTKEKTIVDRETREDTFDSANWAYKQAYTNGRLQSLREIISLFGFLETKGTKAE